MPTESYDIVGSYNNQRVLSIDAERSINLFEYLDAKGKKQKTLIPTSGLINANYNLLGATGGVRAQFFYQNDMYAVVGSTVLRIDTSGNVAILGSFTFTNVGYVGIDANTFQVIFVDGVQGWIWDNVALTFTQITDSSFPSNPIDVCALDGFFVVISGGTNNFQLSSFNQGMVWGPAVNNFTANIITNPNELIIGASTIMGPTGAQNYATGVPFTLSFTATGGLNFTANHLTNMITVPSGIANFSPAGTPIQVISGTGGSLPAPLATNTLYYTTNIVGNNLQLSLTLADAMAGTASVVLTNDGTPPNLMGALPEPLLTNTTYYSIFVDATHIKVASTLINAQANIPISLTTSGAGTFTITGAGQLQQGSVTTHPGTLVACKTLHRRLFLFSQFFTEVWENAGIGTNLPFRRNNTLLMEYGTPAIGSVSVGFDRMLFLSQDRDGLGSVMEVDGTQSIPVSTKALDYQLAQYTALNQVSDCRAFLVKENGLIFYRMNFTLADHTFVYDVSLSDPSNDASKLWHEEETLTRNRHVAQTHAFFNGLNYVGHYAQPIFYILSATTYTNDTVSIPRIRIGRPIVPDAYQRTRIDRFQLDCLQGNVALLNYQFSPFNIITDTGFLLATDSGLLIVTSQKLGLTQQQNPVAFLSYSKDGGQTYGFKQIAKMGKVGERSFRTVWRKLGVVPRGQAFVPMIEFYNNGPFVVLGAAWAHETMPE